MRVQKMMRLLGSILPVSLCCLSHSWAQDCRSFHADFFKVYNTPLASAGTYAFSKADVGAYNAVMRALGIQSTDTSRCYGGMILYELRYSNADDFKDSTPRTVADLVIRDDKGYVLFLTVKGARAIYTLNNREHMPISDLAGDAERPHKALQAACAMLKIKK